MFPIPSKKKHKSPQMKQMKQMRQMSSSEEQMHHLMPLNAPRERSNIRSERQTPIDSQQKPQSKEINKMVLKMKTKKIITEFVSKLKRNNTEPVQFKPPQQYKQANKSQNTRIMGLEVNPHLNSFIAALDILLTLIIYAISAFQSFLTDFREQESTKSVVLIIKLVCIFGFTVRVILQSIKITVIRGQTLQILFSIFCYRLTTIAYWLDILGILLLLLLTIFPKNQVIGILLFCQCTIKMFPIHRTALKLEQLYVETFVVEEVWNLTRVTIYTILYSHFLGGLLLASVNLSPDNNWETEINIQNQPWYQQYIWAFYWSTTLMIGVGFGEITPVYFKIVVMVAFFEIVGFAICEISNVLSLSAIMNFEHVTSKKIGFFRRMADKNKISLQLRARIQNYIRESRTIKQKFNLAQELKLLQSLPKILKYKYVRQFNKTLFYQLPFFRNFQMDTLVLLTQSLKARTYLPKQLILSQRLGPNYIIILKNGVINFTCKKKESGLNGLVVNTVEVDKNDPTSKPFLVDNSFLIRQDSYRCCKSINYDVFAQNYCQTLTMHLDQFYLTLKERPHDLGYFFNFYHHHNLLPHLWQTIPCQYCPNQFHNLFDCPKIHYFAIREIVVLKHIKDNGLANARYQDFSRQRKGFGEERKSALMLRKELFEPLDNVRVSSKNRVKNLFRAKDRKIRTNTEKSIQSIEGTVVTSQREVEKERGSQVFINNYVENSDSSDFTESQSFFEVDDEEELIEQAFRNSKQKLQNTITKIFGQLFLHKTQYFWELQIDIATNYSLYFPDFNPQKLYNRSLKPKKKPQHQLKVIRKSSIGPKEIQFVRQWSIIHHRDSSPLKPERSIDNDRKSQSQDR